MPESVELKINGRMIRVPRGSTVAAAILMTSEPVFRRSVSGELRGPLCGMGICFECRVTVDGREHVRSCQLLCHEGMEVIIGD